MLKHVIEMIFLVFIQGSYAYVTCTNDFDRIMTCLFTPDHRRPTNCSEYSVKVEFYPTVPDLERFVIKRSYDCDPSFVGDLCHCTTDVGDDGFLYGEDPEVILRRNGQIISRSTIIISNNIKPKTPTIISAIQTSEGKPNVTWLTHYKKTYFSEQLQTELQYRPKQSKNDSWERVEEIAMHKTHYVFNNLELSIKYIVKARVYIKINSEPHFSEWSEEFTFHSGTSVKPKTTYAWNVACTNDFDRIMTCVFTPDQRRPTNCSEYSIKVEFYPTVPNLERSYDCDPSFVGGQCHCTADVGDVGFLYGEDPEVILRRNGQIISRSTIIILNNIKPKTPTIISAIQTSEGKPNVTWLTHYKKTYFSEDLHTELQYRPKQSKNDSWERVEEIAMHKTHYVFNNLELSIKYIVKARVYIKINSEPHFSEWSEEFTFHSGTSVKPKTTYAWNVACTNDFDRIMTCVFTPDQRRPTNCSEYSIKVEFYPTVPNLERSYDCDPSFVGGQCHCTADVGDVGFLYGEDPEVILRRNGQIISRSTIIILNNIKPKTPTIISAIQTSEGKPNVTWLTHYKKTYFSEDLHTELQYRPKQSKNDSWERVEEIAMHKTHYVFNNLELNIEFVIKARVYIKINSEPHFSEWSEEFTFHSGTSVESVVKKVVPVICLILLLIVCTLTCCYVKIKKTLIKNKDSFSPEIEALDKTEYMILSPEKTLVSRMVVLIKEHIKEEEKSRIATISVSGSSGNSGQTESSSSTSTSVDYGLTCHVEKDAVQNHLLERLLSAVQQDLERERQIQSAPKMKPLVLPSLSDYESIDTHKPKYACGPSSTPLSNSGCTSASSFDNQCYSVPTSPSPCDSSFFAPSLSCDQGYQSSESFDQPVSVENEWNDILPPLVQTELAYQPCNGCLNSEPERLPQSEKMEANRTFVSQPKEQKVGKDLFDASLLPLGQWSPLVNDDEYRSVQSLIPS